MENDNIELPRIGRRGAPKGHPKYGGRTKGTPNKVTKEHKERIAAFFERHWDEFEEEVWPQLSPKDKKDTFVSLLNFNYPKLSSVDVKQENTAVAGMAAWIREVTGEEL